MQRFRTLQAAYFPPHYNGWQWSFDARPHTDPCFPWAVEMTAKLCLEFQRSPSLVA